MRRRATIRRVVIAAFALAAALAQPRAAAADGTFIVIVHPDNPIAAVGRDTLRDAYLKKIVQWRTGQAIQPLDLAKQFPARERFARDVLRKTTTQLKSYWSQQIFSGKSVPPPAVTTTRAMIEHVLANPGAVGYLPADVPPGGAKVVKVNP